MLFYIFYISSASAQHLSKLQLIFWNWNPGLLRWFVNYYWTPRKWYSTVQIWKKLIKWQKKFVLYYFLCQYYFQRSQWPSCFLCYEKMLQTNFKFFTTEKLSIQGPQLEQLLLERKDYYSIPRRLQLLGNLHMMSFSIQFIWGITRLKEDELLWESEIKLQH